MSMPSSSDEVATSARSAPAFSRSSISTRCGRAIEPWCERTSVSPASSLRAPASRSASRRLLTKMSVERCARISSSSRGWMADQIDGRVSPTDAGSARAMSSAPSSGAPCPRPALRCGDSSALLAPGVDDRDRAIADRSRRRRRTRRRSRRCRSSRAASVRRRRARPTAGARAAALSPRVGGADAARARRRRGTARPRRAAAASRTGRCAAAAVRSAPPAARARARGGRRAWSARARGSRR